MVALSLLAVLALVFWPAAVSAEEPGLEKLQPRPEALGRMVQEHSLAPVNETSGVFYIAQQSPSGGAQKNAGDPEAAERGDEIVTELGLDDEEPAKGEDDLFANADEAARQTANPMGGDFIVWLNQFNFDFQKGDISRGTRNAYTHILQPVIPFPLKFIGDDWIMVNRPTLPIIYSAELPTGPDIAHPGKAEFGNESGLADIISFHLVGVSKYQTHDFDEGDLVLAGGVTTQWPTGNSEFTEHVYAAGPAAVGAWVGKKYIFGALGQHWWDYADQNFSGASKNASNIQVFYFRNFSGGWQIGGAPQIEIDWDAADDDSRLALPIGLGIQKTQFFGKMPIKMGIEVQYYVVQQDTFGNAWRLQLTFAPVTLNFIKNIFD